MKYLLDTNAIIASLNGKKEIRSRLNTLQPSDSLLMCAVVFAELKFGALCSSRKEENLARVESLMPLFDFVDISMPIAERFAHIKATLRQNGIAKSDADLLIAACALEEKATLITNDKALLDDSIPDLIAEDWLL